MAPKRDKAQAYSVVVLGWDIDNKNFSAAKARLARKQIVAVRPDDVKQDDRVVANCKGLSGLAQVYTMCRV